MTPTFDKIHLKFKLNNTCYNHDELKEVSYSLIKEGEAYEKIIGNFLLDWLDEKDFLYVKTSGSTGNPKLIKVSKQAMVNSAIATGNRFKLSPGDTALHCLPTNFIAGKMMLVRAMILGLELDIVEPSTLPAYDDEKPYKFCAMVPMQVQKSLKRLQNINTLIVGGAAVSKSLLKDIEPLKTKVFATYGMAETLSHIAIKPLNNYKGEAHFKLLKDVKISQDDRDCLVVEAPKLTDKTIVTNDIVKLYSKTEFEVIGRYDNMINSGGVKLFPEQIEAKLDGKISQRFFVASQPDDTLGERVVLVLEGQSTELDKAIFSDLEKYEVPKQILFVEQFAETSSKKIQRAKTIEQIK